MPPHKNTDYHLANARLSDIPQLAGLSNINHRKGDDGSRVARQLKCIRDVIREVRTGRSTKSQATPTCSIEKTTAH